MSRVSFAVNGEKVSAELEPRTSLADLMRDVLNLTGTHLGCEQGVCGACTIMVDNVPARSCITSALSCAGAEIRTIEAFDDDPLMAELRRAFNNHHALQCGFCTPGMLIMARDIVERLGDVDEDRIRIELSGNLCRCTGYVGIVKAVRSVILARRQAGIALQPVSHSSQVSAFSLGPTGSGHAGIVSSPADMADAKEASVATPPRPAPREKPRVRAKARPEPSVRQSFTVAFPASTLWEKFGDVPAMVRCIPGANLTAEEPDGSYRVKMRIKMGPIAAEFAGVAAQRRDNGNMTGVISGSGRDARSASLADGELTYRLTGEGNSSTRIDIEVGYVLSGALGQFARAGIVNHFIGAITAQFAENLRRLLAGGTEAPLEGSRSELSLFGSLAIGLKAWLKALLRRPKGG
jgi:carbon-monoxide dehydrogenase small subunit